MQEVDRLVYFQRTALLVGTEVRVRQHRHHRLVSEELHGVVRQAGDIDQYLGRRMTVDQRIGHKERTLLARQDVQGAEMLVARTDTDDLLRHLGNLRVAAVYTRHESVGVAGSHHHHTKGVTVYHFLASLRVGHALARLLVGKDTGVAVAAFRLTVVAEVDDLDTVQTDILLGGDLGQTLLVTQQDRETDTFRFRLGGGFQHIHVVRLREYHPFRVRFRHIGERAQEFIIVPHHLTQMVGVALPVGDRLARHARVDSGFRHGARYTGQQAGIERFRKDIVASESGSFQLIGGVHHVGDRLLGKVGDGVDGGPLHLLVDRLGVRIQGAAEDIRESQHVVDLVRIVGTSGSEDDIVPRGHRIGVGDLRVRVRQGEYDRVGVHATYHLLGQYVRHGEAQEYVGSHHGLLQGLDRTVGSELPLGGVQVRAAGRDDALAVAHDDILLARSQHHVQSRT